MSSEEFIPGGVDAEDVMFIIKRDRRSTPKERELYGQVKQSIKEIGQKIPLKVESITHWPVEKRRRPDGGTYKWRALYGQGRSEIGLELAEETGDPTYRKLPAIRINKADASTIASAFLTENLLRNPLSWSDQAQLMRSDIEAMGGITKANIRKLAKAYFVKPAHVMRLLRVLQKLDPELERELNSMTIQQAEAVASLPKAGQSIVIESVAEEGLPKREIAAVARLARRTIAEGTPLSKKALRDSLKRLREDLERERKTAKPLRLHWSLGPANILTILADKQKRKALDEAGISYAKFEAAVKEGK